MPNISMYLQVILGSFLAVTQKSLSPFISYGGVCHLQMFLNLILLKFPVFHLGFSIVQFSLCFNGTTGSREKGFTEDKIHSHQSFSSVETSNYGVETVKQQLL